MNQTTHIDQSACINEIDPTNYNYSPTTSDTNRGVNSKEFTLLAPPRFDYYRVSLPNYLNISSVRDLMRPIIGEQKVVEKRYIQPGYDFCDEVNTSEQGSLQIFYGGKNCEQHGINICAKGYISDQVASILQNSPHRFQLSRADVCQDFRGNYQEVRSLIARICDQSRINVYDKGACSLSTRTEGMTVQGGSEKSAYQVVCYEKGIQLGQEFPKDYLRLEHRFKPNSAKKVAFGKLSAIEMLGTHKVCRKLSKCILDTDIQQFKVQIPQKEKNPLHHLTTQYWRALNDFFQEHGACRGGEMLAILVKPNRGRLH